MLVIVIVIVAMSDILLPRSTDRDQKPKPRVPVDRALTTATDTTIISTAKNLPLKNIPPVPPLMGIGHLRLDILRRR